MVELSPVLSVRAATVDDVAAISRVHVAAWQETYRGLIPDDVLDAPDALSRRERHWAGILALGSRDDAVAVATAADDVVGFASSGPPRDDDASWPIELYTLYVLRAHHRRGLGTALLDAVLAAGSASLWVAERNPGAQAFYRRHGFAEDGAVMDDGIPEIRMLR